MLHFRYEVLYLHMTSKKSHRQLRTALASIHDVMPDTLPRVREIIHFLQSRNIFDVTLLIVPGLAWSDSDIEQLHSWQQGGLELAGHGWRHRIIRKTTAWHTIHGKLMSRDEAEHLSLSTEEIAEIIIDCYQWFGEAGLSSPSLYVPPAWAMGALPRRLLHRLPFTRYETLSGVYDCHTAILKRMPLTGYMADTRFRCGILHILNTINLHLLPGFTRIAIHPGDLQLPLKGDLSRHLTRFQRFISYKEAFNRIQESEKPVFYRLFFVCQGPYLQSPVSGKAR